jgi:hypothetical protein
MGGIDHASPFGWLHFVPLEQFKIGSEGGERGAKFVTSITHQPGLLYFRCLEFVEQFVESAG